MASLKKCSLNESSAKLWSWDDIHAGLSRPQAFYSLDQWSGIYFFSFYFCNIAGTAMV